MIKPSKWLPGYFLGFNHTDEMIDTGLKDAIDAIKKIKF